MCQFWICDSYIAKLDRITQKEEKFVLLRKRKSVFIKRGRAGWKDSALLRD